MDESFLRYLWKFRLLTPPYYTNKGDKVVVIKPGIENFDAGPDFLDSVIKIGNTTWAGNVEIHIKSSDWNKHGHHNDYAFNSVILHVVYKDDAIIFNASGAEMLCFPVENSFPGVLYENYMRFYKSGNWVPCSKLISNVPGMILLNRLTRLAVERMEKKSLFCFPEAEATRWDWEETLYRLLARAFGGRVNAEAFYRLACNTPFKILARERGSLTAAEALLYGQSGILNNSYKDEYPKTLYKEYSYYKSKYNFKSMGQHEWRFMRIRPAGFPTIRISQFAAMISNNYPLFSKILDLPAEKIIGLFAVKAAKYWDNHYIFDEISGEKAKNLGNDAASVIIINSIVPVLSLYGHIRDDEHLKQKSSDILNILPPENNKITRKWAEFGVVAKNAADSQALIELKNSYCDFKKCLQCGIGHYILTEKFNT